MVQNNKRRKEDRSWLYGFLQQLFVTGVIALCIVVSDLRDSVRDLLNDELNRKEEIERIHSTIKEHDERLDKVEWRIYEKSTTPEEGS
jgi:hypothetical protein